MCESPARTNDGFPPYVFFLGDSMQRRVIATQESIQIDEPGESQYAETLKRLLEQLYERASRQALGVDDLKAALDDALGQLEGEAPF